LGIGLGERKKQAELEAASQALSSSVMHSLLGDIS